MEPINYMGVIPQVNPMQGFLSGLQTGTALRESGLRTQEIQQKLDADKAAQDRTEQYRAMLSDYMSDPKYSKLQQLQVAFPEQEKAFKPLIEQMDKRQLMAEQSAGIQITTALKNNNAELANRILDESIEAAKNSGLDTTAFERVKSSLAVDPTATLGMVQWLTTHTMTPEQQEKFAKAQQTLEETQQSKEMFSAKLREATAKAGTAESESVIKAEEAKIAPQKVQADYQKVLESIKDSQLGRELDKKRVQIAAMNAQVGKTGNDLKRQELSLKVAEMQRDFIQKVDDRRAEGEGKVLAITTGRNLINEILSDEDTLRAATGATAFRGMIPGTKARSMAGKLDQLKNMLALENIQQLKGAASDKDIELVSRVGANLDRYQDEDQLINDINKVSVIFKKAEKKAKQQYGVTESRKQERRNISGADAAAALGI